MTAPANQNKTGLDEYGKVWTSGCSFDRFHKDGRIKFNVRDRSSVAAPV